MGLFDFFNSKGVLSDNAMQEAPSPFIQTTNHRGEFSRQMNPAYTQYIDEQADPRNMNTGMKLMLLGQAMQGQDVTGSITDYQKGIRDRFRQRAMDDRQFDIDQINRKQTMLNMANTRQNMRFDADLQPGKIQAQTLQNRQNALMNPLLLEQQRLSNTSADNSNVLQTQQIEQGKNLAARWVGDSETGAVMQMNPFTGIDEDVTDQYTDAMISAFKAAAKPKTAANNPVNPGVNRPLTAGELEIDKQFAKDISKFDYTALSGNVSMLTMIAEGLATQQTGDGATGLSWWNPLKSAARILDKDGDMGLRAILDDESMDVQELVAGVIQKNLRETLGAQFTQREGMLLIQRAYNPQLSPQVNARRLQAAAMLAEAYIKNQQAKVDYYNSNNGSLAGYDPKMDDALTSMELQVREIFLQNGGLFGDNPPVNTPAPTSGTTSTNTSWTVTPSGE